MNRLLLSLLCIVGTLSLRAQTPPPQSQPSIPAPALATPPAPAPGPAVLPEPEPKAPAAAKKPAKKKAAPSSLPFRGELASTDAKAMTITLAGKEKQRVFHVTSKTRFERDGHPTTFSDLKAGEAVRGSYAKGKEGDSLIRLVVGAAPAPKKPAAKKQTKKDAAAQ